MNICQEHKTYLEPFFGSGAVFFNKFPSPLETINDINGDVINLFRIIRDQPEKLVEKLRWTPYSREEYHAAHEASNDGIEQARRFLVRCWQSIRVKTGSISGWKCRGTSDEVYHIKQWNSLPDDVLLIASRLKEVQIENRPAIDLIERYCRPEVLIYADPPYVMASRNGKMYEDEMTDEDHIQLLEMLDKHPGPVILSGYENDLYKKRLNNWHFEMIAGKPVLGQQRTEVLWLNPVASEHFGQQSIFSLLEQGM